MKILLSNILLLAFLSCTLFISANPLQQNKIDSAYLANAKFIENKQKVKQFYKNRNYEGAWFQGQQPKAQAMQLLQEIKNAEEQGLMFRMYTTEEYKELENYISGSTPLQPEQIKRLELQLTDLFFKYAKHVNMGIIGPDDVSYGYYIREKEENSILLLESILSSEDQKFKKLEPQHPQYKQLKAKLAEYRNIEKGGGWPAIKGIKILEKGDSSEAVTVLRKRLVISGDLSSNNNSHIYDDAVIAAVEKFQTRHGLKVDGVVGPKTLEELNKPISERIKQIIVNMERLRWLPSDMGNPHVMVNIPEFMLYVNKGPSQVMKMKVITGKTVNATVIFSDSISYLEMSPYWNVPYSIATQEILPKVKGNPGYLSANHYEVLYGNKVLNPYNINWHKYNTSNFPYRIRQTPGLHNALGTIKFIFPNKFNIYLHDTPSKHLFDQVERDFSHGCIRVEKPLEFAKFLLADQPEWTAEKIQEYRQHKSPERVYLTEKVPVYILYFTAFVDENGILNFREDIYNHDQELTNKFFARQPY